MNKIHIIIFCLSCLCTTAAGQNISVKIDYNTNGTAVGNHLVIRGDSLCIFNPFYIEPGKDSELLVYKKRLSEQEKKQLQNVLEPIWESDLCGYYGWRSYPMTLLSIELRRQKIIKEISVSFYFLPEISLLTKYIDDILLSSSIEKNLLIEYNETIDDKLVEKGEFFRRTNGCN